MPEPADTATTLDTPMPDEDGWYTLFNGENLDGWQASEAPGSFTVEDGSIVAHGPRSHLFYVGDVADHDFKNFEFMAEVMTTEGSNSGLYFHTAYQEEGWPSQGYEVQINNTSSDPRKTGSLYAVSDVNEAPAADGEWFTEHIIVQGKDVTVNVNGETVVEYTEPDMVERPEDMQGRVLGSGTFAIQAHDPDSRVYVRNIRVKLLPD